MAVTLCWGYYLVNGPITVSLAATPVHHCRHSSVRWNCLRGFPGESTTNHSTRHIPPLSSAPISVGSPLGLCTQVRNLDSCPGSSSTRTCGKQGRAFTTSKFGIILLPHCALNLIFSLAKIFHFTLEKGSL